MSLPARITDFLPGSQIKSQPFDDEFNQLVNLLSGVSQNKSVRVINNDASFAAARFDQRAANNILELYADGAEVGRVERDGDLVVAGLTGVGALYTFAQRPILPASSPTLANEAVRKQYVDDKIVYNTLVAAYTDDPNTYPLTSNAVPIWPAPGGATSITITRIGIIYGSGSHTVGGNLVFTLFVNGVTTGQTIALDNNNNTVLTPYYNNFADITPVTNAWFQLTTRSGTISERAVSVLIEYFQKLT